MKELFVRPRLFGVGVLPEGKQGNRDGVDAVVFIAFVEGRELNRLVERDFPMLLHNGCCRCVFLGDDVGRSGFFILFFLLLGKEHAEERDRFSAERDAAADEARLAHGFGHER